MASALSCGPCLYDDVAGVAKRWCTYCEEGLCEDCENVHRKSKISRNHKVISIEDYRKIENFSISQVCGHHGKNLEWFCTTHDKALCMVCVTSNHKSCSGVVPISVASTNATQSTALADLEETIEGTLLNVKQCIINRQSATKEIEKRELVVKTIIHETRAKINGHLDKLEEKLLLELRSASHTCKSKCAKFLQNLESTEDKLTKLREQTIHMKQFSSDIQVFLGTRQINNLVVSETESIKSAIGTTKDNELKIVFHNLIAKLLNEVKEFGQIKVSDCATSLHFRDIKIDQAQIGITVPTSRNMSKIKLQVMTSFDIFKYRKHTMNISSCVTLPDGHFLMANGKGKHLIQYNDKGKHVRAIPVSSRPYDITVIKPNRIAVSYGDAKFLEIININTFTVEKRIKLQDDCFGVSEEDGRLYVVGYSSIQVLDLSGRQLETLKMELNDVYYITTSKDRIFYTDTSKNKVHCCRLNGEELWQFESESIRLPVGITVDNKQNVYVVGHSSRNLTVIQHDGKDSTILLTVQDGLNKPNDVYFDIEKRTLLICNERGRVTLYKVN
ncbi:E3 ubiquitin-protein ligase TRIM71-like [Mytilus californianus]|uniref:E3 ubiquitin-protein ligase TRIM71-like n=1 Tax=Mytilus californianus TaxID=6549 RepID=UPI0022450E69|nr:E3 ubiquitin-protein ligase TRIM71-like [Mytilus californianus]